jgi:outer membrane lipoprotein SlyB
VDRERHLVHDRPLDAGDLHGVLLAAALLQTGERAVLTCGMHERVAARIDLSLAAAEVQRRRLLGALRALEVGLHREEVGAAGLSRHAAALAGLLDALVGGGKVLLAAPLMGQAGGELLGRALLGALAQGTNALETKLKGTGAHEPVIGGSAAI